MSDLLLFTNCYLPQEDGKLLLRDLWIDQQSGRILDAQVNIHTNLSHSRALRSPALLGNLLRT